MKKADSRQNRKGAEPLITSQIWKIYGLIGRNGAGETTVLRLISGLAKTTEGDICLFEQNSHDTVYAKNRVGIWIENPGTCPNMSAKDNVKLKCLAMGVSGKSYIAGLLGGLHGQWR